MRISKSKRIYVVPVEIKEQHPPQRDFARIYLRMDIFVTWMIAGDYDNSGHSTYLHHIQAHFTVAKTMDVFW